MVSRKHALRRRRFEHERTLRIVGSRAGNLYYGYINNMAVRRTVFDSVAPFAEVAGADDVVSVRRVIGAFFPDAGRYAPGPSWSASSR